MATYDTWLLILVAPVLWWLMAMFRAVVDVRARQVPITGWDTMEEANCDEGGVNFLQGGEDDDSVYRVA